MLTRYRFLILWILFLSPWILSNCAEKTSDYYVQKGKELTGEEKYEEALESYKKAVEKGPENPNGYYGMGGIYNYKERYDEAEKAFKKVIQLDPTFIDAHYSLGYTYEMQGRKEEAENQYARYRNLKKRFDTLVQRDLEKH